MTSAEFCENGAPLEAPEQQELTQRQRAIVWVTAAAVALARLLALSKSLWDWDEALFCSALQEFNVSWTPHGIEFHPHPPGFPLFIATAHVARLFTHTEFAALRAVSTIAAMLLFPLTFALARSLRMTFLESYAAALMLVFLPNVWFYGGTAFSDVAALATMLAAAAALFASRSGDRRLYIAGCLLLGAAIAFRPQNALIGGWPWLAASLGVRRQGRRFGVIAAGAALVTAVALGAYAGAALASDSVAGYIAAVRAHEHYVSTVDSFRNPDRPDLFYVFVRMVFNPFFARKAMIGLWALAICGVASMRRAAIDALLTFAPFAVFAWLMLDWYGASRLSLGFIAVVPLLAVLGITRLVPRRVEAVAPVAAAVFVAAYFIQWTWPALREARSTDSPPVEASRWITRHVDRSHERLYVEEGLAGQADYLLTGYRIDVVPEDFSAANEPDPGHGWVLAEGATVLDRAIDFRRPHGRLWNIARRRFFELAVLPLTNWVTFREGWLEGENYDLAVWRWMGRHSVTILPAVPGRGALRIRGHVPSDALPRPAVMTVRLNGQVLDQFAVPDDEVDRHYIVETRPGLASELTIDVDQALNLKQRGVTADARDLGFQLKGLSWQPAR
jgi:hypothetical protein